MVGKETFFSLLTAPSTWTDLSNESGEKWSEQTAKRPSGLKCARCVRTEAFHFARRVLSIGDGRKFRPIYQKHYCILARHNIAKVCIYKKQAKESWGTILSNFIPSLLRNQNNNSLSAYQISHICLDFVESLTSLPFSIQFLLLRAKFCSSNNGGCFDRKYTG